MKNSLRPKIQKSGSFLRQDDRQKKRLNVLTAKNFTAGKPPIAHLRNPRHPLEAHQHLINKQYQKCLKHFHPATKSAIMASHNDTGKLGEELATTYFIEKGYTILERNWRFRHYEIDIVAHKNNMLHFIEVKCRRTLQYGHPEESVSRQKIKMLIDASAEYLYKNPQWQRIQFDVLSITIVNGGTEYFLIEDVYY